MVVHLRHPWVDGVLECWPGPVAHEYHRLRELTEAGHLVSSILQLKDVAEVLIDLPALIMARDLIEHGRDEPLKAAIRSAMLSKPPSMGDWHRLAQDLLAPAILKLAHAADCPLVFPELATLFRQPKAGTPPTPFSAFLLQLINWRNEEIAHGAFRLNVASYGAELERHLTRLNELLAADRLVSLWRDTFLTVGTREGERLHGHMEGLRARLEPSGQWPPPGRTTWPPPT